MDLPSVKIRRILYATDLSENARIAFTYAVSLAEQYDAQIVILHALLEAYDLAIAYIGKAEWEKIKQEYYRKAQNILIGKRNECSAIKAALRKFADNAQKENGLKSVDDDEIIVEYGNPVEKILTVSEEKKCDLIVMGTHGTGSIMDAMMGSTTTRVLRRSKIPVMVIRLPEYIRKRFLSKVLSTIDIQKERYKTPFDYSQCARCGINVADRLCQKVDGKFPNGCPTNNSTQVIKAALDEMQKSGAFDFARQSTIQEGEGYGDRELGYARVRPIKSRIEETIEFSTRMNYRRLGLAFCLGLRKEARVVDKLLTEAGFEVVSAMCKIGRIDKNYIGVRDDQKIRLCGLEPMCNPIAQAFVLNEAQTDFNITVGLCVGHDSLFLKYSEALCTVFAVKDRVLGHNPLAAIYTLDSYYRVLK